MKPHERERLQKLLSDQVDPKFTAGHRPWPKQTFALQSDAFELMFGGAAGGGKSDFLLMDFLKFVHKPQYRGLILRRRSVDLKRSEAILDRAIDWWCRPGTGVRYQAGDRKFIFPSGATCEFGHMNNEIDKLNYQGGSWHFIAFDELTQFTGSQYLYLFSRLRRVLAAGEEPLPLRVRSASNPGGPSHYFVRDRFMTLDYAKKFLAGSAADSFIRTVRTSLTDGTVESNQREFIPSKSADNFALDVNAYEMNLAQLDPVERARLMSGNWLIAQAGRFKPEWFGRFVHPDYLEGDYYQLYRHGSIESRWLTIHPRDCTRFITIDPAGTEAEREAEEAGRREPSHSVISTWDLWNERSFLLWRDVQRCQKEFPDVVELIVETWNNQGRPTVVIEIDGIGKSYYQTLQRRGVNVVAIGSEGKGKLERSVFAQNEAAEHRVWLPDFAPWLQDLEAELFQWTGLKSEVADQIDTFSHAAKAKKDGLVGANILQRS